MNIKSITQYILTCILAIAFYSCNSDLSEATGFDNNDKEQTCKMILDADCPTFMDESGTRAENGRWEEGDKVYIHISSTIYGVGTYQNGDWEFTYDGKLSNMNSAPCSLYYIKGNCESSDNQLFTMDEKSAIYGTTTGIYSYFAGELTVSATLRPLTSRMRLKGEANTHLVFMPSEALMHYQQLDVAKDQLTAGTGNASLTVNADGYTDYIYVMAEENVSLALSLRSAIYTEKQLSKSLFSAGASGYIEIPSSDSFDGWIKKDAPKAILLGGGDFNSTINSLSGGNYSLIKSIVFDYNSSISSGEVVSYSDSELPIYANFDNGIVTISTQASEITVLDMMYMFRKCSDITTLDLSGFDTHNVKDMKSMFLGCSNLTTLDLSGFDTHNVKDMSSMFGRCSSLTTLDLSGFDTHNVTSMWDMFSGCSNLTTLDLSEFNTQEVTNMFGMFERCTNLSSLDLSGFNTQNVTDMSYMFGYCENLPSLDLPGFNTQNVTSMDGMFRECTNLSSLDLSGFNTQNVTIMECMFYGCGSLTSLDLSRFNTQNVKDMKSMFWGCTNLTTLDLSGFDTQNVTDMSSMFSYCTSLTSLDLSRFNTQNVTDMLGMFDGCTNLTTLDLSGFDTQNVTDMRSMFRYCTSLTSLDLSRFNTKNVTDMSSMFSYCTSLTSLDLSRFNTQNVTDMLGMFDGCTNLTTLDLSGFDTQNVTDMRSMFWYCTNMYSLKLGTQFTLSSSTKKSNMFVFFTQDAGRCTISCTEATQNAISEGTGLVTDYITWDILH